MKANQLAVAFLFLVADMATAQQRASPNSTNTTSETATNVIVQLDIKAGEQGDADAQYRLGSAYENGRGVETNAVEALKWYRAAAEHGNVDAQSHLASLYFFAEKVERDYKESAKWARKAAEAGDAWAQDLLGTMLDEGYGMKEDPVEGAKWHRKAAEQGDANASCNLAMCYERGRGVEMNYGEALKWYRLALAKDDSSFVARTGLGRMNRLGKGVPKDFAEALRFLRPAATKGWPPAQYELGLMYANGEGVSQDYVEAYKWYNLAAYAQDDAATTRDTLAGQMTPVEITEAQRLTREFKAGKESVSGISVSPKRTAKQRASGTGFFISEDGFLITNEHVVRDPAQVRLVTSAGLISAKVVKVDAANDLALLKAEGKFSPLPVAASRGVKLGGTVATVGFPNIGLQGFAPKLAKGEIASLSGASDDARYFQISVPVQPGNSGGALVDERGNVVGVVSAKLSAKAALAASGSLPENVNYAVKSSYLLSFLESVPDVASKLKEPETKEQKFEDVVKSAEQAAVLVLVY